MSYNTNVSKSYLFQLSIPIFFSNLAVPLVGLTDTFLMGHMESEKFLAATSISTAVMTMILWSFGFLRMGTVGIVAQCLGRGDYRGIILTIFRNFIIALVISILIILLKPIIINLINKYTGKFFSDTKTLLSNIESVLNDSNKFKPKKWYLKKHDPQKQIQELSHTITKLYKKKFP